MKPLGVREGRGQAFFPIVWLTAFARVNASTIQGTDGPRECGEVQAQRAPQMWECPCRVETGRQRSQALVGDERLSKDRVAPLGVV